MVNVDPKVVGTGTDNSRMTTSSPGVFLATTSNLAGVLLPHATFDRETHLHLETGRYKPNDVLRIPLD